MQESRKVYASSAGVWAKVRRRWTALRTADPIRMAERRFLLTMTFDDVPDSAATIGAEILAERGMRASWYVATGLLGRDSPSGRVLDAARVRELDAAGHEIALHGHGHFNLDRCSGTEALADIARNRAELADILGHPPAPHLAYPYGETNPALKRALCDQVRTARGVRAGINRSGADRLQLCAFDLRPDPWRLQLAEAALAEAARGGGWVILFTHDVAPDPSRYGIAPDTLRHLLARAADLGAEVCTMAEGHALSRSPAG